jgi:hypothetical protein
MFRMGGFVVGWVSLLIAAAVLIVARRHTYGLHMLRGVAGVGLFALSLFMLTRSTQNATWVGSADVAAVEERFTGPEDGHPAAFTQRHARGRDGRMDAAVEHYFSGVESRHLVLANIVSLLSLLVLCWPARRGGRRGAPVTVHQNFGTIVQPPRVAPEAGPADADAVAERAAEPK